MQPLTVLSRLVLKTLREHLRPLIAFHLFFTCLASLLLLPGIAWILRWILAQLGDSVITTHALIDLLFSLTGLVIALPVLASAFIVLYWQQAGMLHVAIRPHANHYRLAITALWLSTRLDIYYLQVVRPPVFWYFIASALPMVGIWIWLASWLYLRWVLALPLVALDCMAPLPALRHSVTLTRGWRRSMGVAVLAVLGVIIVLPLLVTWVFDHLVTPLLWWLPEHNALLIPATLAYLTGYVMLTLGITFLGIVINALLTACLIASWRTLPPRQPPLLPTRQDVWPGR